MFSRAFPEAVYATFYPERQDEAPGYALASIRYLCRSMYKPWLLLGSRRLLASAAASREVLAGKTDEELKDILRRLQGEIIASPSAVESMGEFFAVFVEATRRTLGIRLSGEHVRAGWYLLHGTVVNLGPGGGKTLVAAMAATYASFVRIPVHIVHLTQEQAGDKKHFLEPLYGYLGVSSGVGGAMGSMQGETPYAADITHICAQELALDYLRDSVALGRKPGDIQAELRRLSRRKRYGETRLRGLPFAIIDDAEALLLDLARKQVAITGHGDSRYEDQVYEQAIEMAAQLRPGDDFLLDESQASVHLTEVGRVVLARLADGMEGVWAGRQRRETLVLRALIVLYLLEAGRDYVVSEGAVQLLDGNGPRRWGPLRGDRAGQKMIEIKEGVTPEGQRELRASLTYQRLFQRYCMLAGLTASDSRAGRELWEVYRLGTVSLGAGKRSPVVPVTLHGFLQDDDRWEALQKRVEELQRDPVLVVVVFRKMSGLKWFAQSLQEIGCAYEVLTGQVVDQEGAERKSTRQARVLLVTTLQKLEFMRLQQNYPEGAGRIHCLFAEKLLARYQEDSFIGLCRRETGTGEAEFYVSSLDDLLEGRWIQSWYRWLLTPGRDENFMSRLLCRGLLSIAQRSAEARRSRQRLNAMRQETASDKSLAFTGPPL